MKYKLSCESHIEQIYSDLQDKLEKTFPSDNLKQVIKRSIRLHIPYNSNILLTDEELYSKIRLYIHSWDFYTNLIYL